MVDSLIFIEARAGDKKNRSWSKKDLLRNTGLNLIFDVFVLGRFQLLAEFFLAS